MFSKACLDNFYFLCKGHFPLLSQWYGLHSCGYIAHLDRSQQKNPNDKLLPAMLGLLLALIITPFYGEIICIFHCL